MSAEPEPAEPAGDVVRAAGCLVWRRGSGGIEVLVAHRPRYDDWSFPKGKLDPGETSEAAAVREVEEETGVTGRLGPQLATTRYRDHRGRAKEVRYWALEATGGRFEPNDEVDEVRWVPRHEVPTLLSYDHDRTVVEALPPDL